MCSESLTGLVVTGFLWDAHVDHDIDGIRHVQVEISGAHLTVLCGDQTCWSMDSEGHGDQRKGRG